MRIVAVLLALVSMVPLTLTSGCAKESSGVRSTTLHEGTPALASSKEMPGATAPAVPVAAPSQSAPSHAPSHAPAPEPQAKNAPVSVRQTVEMTLESHKGIKILQENLEVVRRERDRAEAGWGPSLDLTGRTGFSRLSNTTTRPLGADNKMYGASDISLTLTQPLWDGFATRSRVRTGEATVDSVISRVIDNATTFGLDSIIAHVDVLRRTKIVRLSEENVRQHRIILESQKERVALGASSAADESQTEARLHRAEATLMQAQASLAESRTAYTRLTGRAVPEYLEAVPLPAELYSNKEEVFKIAKDNNPKIIAYLADVDAQQGEKELAQAAYHPKVNLEVGPSYSDRSGPGNQWSSGMDAMLVMRWNLFNNGADDDAVRAASARVRQTREYAYNFYDNLLQEITDTWTRYITARNVRDAYEKALHYNTITRDSYLEQFSLGQRSLLDVLDAENELFNSATEQTTAAGNVLVGAYRLQALAGTMLPNMGIDTEPLLIEYEQKQNTSQPTNLSRPAKSAKRP